MSTAMKWTRYYDMHSGGGRKTDFEIVFIEAPADMANLVFERLFGRDPTNVTCSCCGGDYSIEEAESEESAKKYYTDTTPARTIYRAEVLAALGLSE